MCLEVFEPSINSRAGILLLKPMGYRAVKVSVSDDHTAHVNRTAYRSEYVRTAAALLSKYDVKSSCAFFVSRCVDIVINVFYFEGAGGRGKRKE